jgi:hypothetical protein
VRPDLLAELVRLEVRATMHDAMAADHPLLLVEVGRAAWRHQYLEPLRRLVETLSGSEASQPTTRPALPATGAPHSVRHEALPAQDADEEC